MNDLLWQRVEAALDARRDPLDDADLAQALSRDPDDLAAVRRLMARVEALPVLREPATANPGHNPRSIATLAAGLLAFVTATLLLFGQRADGPLITAFSLATARSTAARPYRPNVSLTIETTTPEPARGQRVVLAPRRVITWNLEKR
ncbi:MAG: hypothetical protein ACI8QZ_004410 [Chlamydiales bacterium]|jgi:hypothetical protein